MSINLTASISTVGGLFSDTKIFRIPEFQRPYSWDEEKALQFFEDLQIAYVDRERIDSGNYFLGTLIIKKDGQFNNCIVDGQQRLVTLTVILAVIRDLYDATYKADLQNILIRQANQTLRLDKSPRIHLRLADNENFFKCLSPSSHYLQHVVSGCFLPYRNAKQGIESSMSGFSPVETEDEFIEIGLQMFAAQAVIDAKSPGFQV